MRSLFFVALVLLIAAGLAVFLGDPALPSTPTLGPEKGRAVDSGGELTAPTTSVQVTARLSADTEVTAEAREVVSTR